jgi:hypothetical protein
VYADLLTIKDGSMAFKQNQKASKVRLRIQGYGYGMDVKFLVCLGLTTNHVISKVIEFDKSSTEISR